MDIDRLDPEFYRWLCKPWRPEVTIIDGDDHGHIDTLEIAGERFRRADLPPADYEAVDAMPLLTPKTAVTCGWTLAYDGPDELAEVIYVPTRAEYRPEPEGGGEA